MASTLHSADEQKGERGGTLAAEVEMREFAGAEDAAAFCALNEEWISRYFVLEERDREQLRSPETMLARGGRIFMARRLGETVGCVALIPMEEGVLELSKMAVTPAMRGLGVGRAILTYAIAQARAMGARRLFLGSSTKLVSAVALYESAGFRHVDPETLPKMAYARANVFMAMEL